jgi:hypothetical protein
MTVINTYHIGVYTRQTSKDVGFLAVLTEDASGQLAVYIGISGNLDPDSDGYSGHRDSAAEYIAAKGNKQTYKQALYYFPSIRESEYRA